MPRENHAGLTAAPVPKSRAAGYAARGWVTVYVFHRGTTAWTQATYAKATNTDDEDKFGEVVALSHDAIVVGASNEDSSGTGINSNGSDNTAFEAGAAYLFH